MKAAVKHNSLRVSFRVWKRIEKFATIGIILLLFPIVVVVYPLVHHKHNQHLIYEYCGLRVSFFSRLFHNRSTWIQTNCMCECSFLIFLFFILSSDITRTILCLRLGQPAWFVFLSFFLPLCIRIRGDLLLWIEAIVRFDSETNNYL